MGDLQSDPSDAAGQFSRKTRPLTAMFAGARFLLDLEDTRHFFTLTDAVDGPQHELNYQRYIASKVGSLLNAEEVNFAKVLSDRAYLEAFHPGSLASAYIGFLSAENLQLELLMIAEQNAAVANLNLEPTRRRYMASGIALHDLLHVLTRYGRDPVGEACLLAFTAEQLQLRGIAAIALAIALREQARQPQKPILKMLKEAKVLAREATWAPEVDWRIELAKTPDEARASVSIGCPELYLSSFGALEPVSKAVVSPSTEELAA
ncbi:MAG: Coq4 family protein [Pseudomonadota bacterium]